LVENGAPKFHVVPKVRLVRSFKSKRQQATRLNRLDQHAAWLARESDNNIASFFCVAFDLLSCWLVVDILVPMSSSLLAAFARITEQEKADRWEKAFMELVDYRGTCCEVK